MADHVAAELLQLEISYVGGLKHMITKFYEPLQNALRAGNPILSADDMDTIFARVEPLYNCHAAQLEMFMTALKPAIDALAPTRPRAATRDTSQSSTSLATTSSSSLSATRESSTSLNIPTFPSAASSDPSPNGSACPSPSGSTLDLSSSTLDVSKGGMLQPDDVANMFLSLWGKSAERSFSSCYTKFVNKYGAASFTLKRCLQKNEKFREMVESSSNRFEKRYLQDLLITPIQQTPRYVMVLQRLSEKFIKAGHPPNDGLEQSIVLIKEVAKYIDAKKGEAEAIEQVAVLEKQIGNIWPQFVQPDRMYLGTFDVMEEYLTDEESSGSSSNGKAPPRAEEPKTSKASLRKKLNSTIGGKVAAEFVTAAASSLGLTTGVNRHRRHLIVLNDLILCVKDSTSVFSKDTKFECTWACPLHVSRAEVLTQWRGKNVYDKEFKEIQTLHDELAGKVTIERRVAEAANRMISAMPSETKKEWAKLEAAEATAKLQALEKDLAKAKDRLDLLLPSHCVGLEYDDGAGVRRYRTFFSEESMRKQFMDVVLPLKERAVKRWVKRKNSISNPAAAGLPTHDLGEFPSVTGRLHLTLVEAENLAAKDVGGKSDPYCTVKLDDRLQFKTKHINKTLEPVWNADFMCDVKDSYIMELDVFDHDRFGKDELCGSVAFPLSRLPQGVENDVWLSLAPKGRIHVVIKLE
ncbi:hypothetical protein CAOG_06896 [Capsaspora owczarzaki ATCC 30864]|uniref:hypothetical protein n=1 Tax=Capsaspora owczarzaki (strain ATCC 30864) TaxID=595528 RepID=UPI0003522EFA|nr:hypothetical protein CAOG_06896 [Capsaspora owczarzaki ATCC 30864]|eukprot:XP_004344517.2 hypothetical protein CAOG_06896 [Capsaspora owczarzaki ATCC 30864]